MSWLAKIASGIRSGAERWPTVSGPEIAVTTGVFAAEAVAVAAGAVSHTAHADVPAVRTGIAEGAPTMPTVGPLGYFASSPVLTNVGFLASPATNRALIRFNAGCSRPPTRT